MISLLIVDHTLSSKYQLAFEYLSKNDTMGVHTVLDNIPSMFSLTPEEINCYQSYLSYFRVMNALIAKGKSIRDLSQSQVATMQDLMESGLDPVKSLARNVLIANNLCNYKEPIILPNENKSAKEKSFIKTGKIITQSLMKLFPNPANQYIIVEYNLKDKLKNGQEIEITVNTNQGQQVFRKILAKQQDEVLISTITLPMGTYLCSINVSGKILETQRFMIIR